MGKYKILKDYEQTLFTVQDIISDGVTSNLQLDRLGFMIFGLDYLGTYSSDQLPKYIRNNQCFILNTDPSTKKKHIGSRSINLMVNCGIMTHLEEQKANCLSYGQREKYTTLIRRIETKVLKKNHVGVEHSPFS